MNMSGSNFVTMIYVYMYLHIFIRTSRKVLKVIFQTAKSITSEQQTWSRQIIKFLLIEFCIASLVKINMDCLYDQK